MRICSTHRYDDMKQKSIDLTANMEWQQRTKLQYSGNVVKEPVFSLGSPNRKT